MKDRIIKLRKDLKLTQTEFGASIGLTRNAIAAYERGIANPTGSAITAICRIYNINRAWLETGEGEMYVETDSAMIDRIVAEYNGSEVFRTILETYITMPEDNRRAVEDFISQLMDYKKGIPKETASVTDLEVVEKCAPSDSARVEYRRYTSPAAASTPLWAESEYETLTCAADDVPDGADYAVGIQGKSMEPDIPDGSTVWVKRSYMVEDGDIVIAWVDGEGTVCKQARCKGDKIVCLHSINPAYPDIKGQDLSELRIYGIVVGKMD